MTTELTASVTNDGTTWDSFTLTDAGEYEDGKRIIVGTLPSGMTSSDDDFQYKIETDGVDLRIHGVGLSWE